MPAKPATKSPPAPIIPPRATASPPSARLRIRMYRQGLGDCFLLTFDSTTHVLIDCGVIVGTQKPEPLMTRVVENIREVTHGRVDVLVVTHEHWDHVSGFTQARAAFEQVEFKEVWMAWTEEPGNALADHLRAQRSKKLKALKAAMTRLAKSPQSESSSLRAGLADVLGFAGLGFGAAAAGSGDTGEAMSYARNRGKSSGSSLRFLHPGQPVFSLPGPMPVRVYVLGPPEDEALLKRSDPSQANSEVYLTLTDSFLAALDSNATDSATSYAALPFAPERQVVARQGKPGPGASAALKHLFATRYLANAEAYRTIEEDWLASAGSLALKLDSDTNNTSLVLAFEFTDTGEVLLFPGDAQVGNWLSWDKYQWSVKGPDGQSRSVNAADLLSRTLVYKVGHHGSHNATLRALGLERMTNPDLVAMIPVNQAMAKKKQWQMPWPDLRRRLQEKCSSVIVQDEAEAAAPPKRGRIEVAPADDNQSSLYVDYFL